MGVSFLLHSSLQLLTEMATSRSRVEVETLRIRLSGAVISLAEADVSVL